MPAGLPHFSGTNMPIFMHEKELKHAFSSVATKTDAGILSSQFIPSFPPFPSRCVSGDDCWSIGVYHPKDLNTKLSWQAFHGDTFEICQGMILRHAPGRTPGLAILQVQLAVFPVALQGIC